MPYPPGEEQIEEIKTVTTNRKENVVLLSALVDPPGLSRGPVQTPRCHRPSELCSPALSSQQEQKD